MAVLSNPQKIILFVISVIFMALVWNMIPIPTPLKIILYIFLTPLTLALVFSVPYTFLSESFLGSFVEILVAFIVIPLLLNLVVLFRHDDYIASLPKPEKVDLVISCDIDRTRNSGVGNEWGYIHTINGIKFQDNDVINIDINKSITLNTTITEYDDIDDIGIAETTYNSASELYDYEKSKTITHNVFVRERGGRKNKGSSADFIVTYTLRRKQDNFFVCKILPIKFQLAPVGFWTLLFFTDNIFEVVILSYLLLCEVLYYTIIVLENVYERQDDKNKAVVVLERIIVALLIPIIILVSAVSFTIYGLVLLIQDFVYRLKNK